jgi:hypothetical protein
MRWAFACWLVVAGCKFTAPSVGDDDNVDADIAVADASIDAATGDTGNVDAIDLPKPLHLHVEAKIDGRSNLILHGTTVQWMHYQFAAPGRETFTNLPTKLDAVDWQPVWPDIPDAENRDCSCMSSMYTTLPTPLPDTPSNVTVTHTLGRRTTTPTAIQLPTSANDYTLIVEFTDVGLGGSDIYGADIDVVAL